ncbi:unnamed protein product [Macrosiphum euphorbiae]|uniref:BESS domain-containing protein n=1 Tax=Macrosiphum euphorbiae TaxID=13131 RepID=A0AAV0WN45_9HEMI|nr:unnamed protein product [Macrosiphum euphorbiae]
MINRYIDKQLIPTRRLIDKTRRANFPLARDTKTDNCREATRRSYKPCRAIPIRRRVNCTTLYHSTLHATRNAPCDPTLRSGAQGTSYKPKWPFFEFMLFVKDTLLPNVTSGNLPTPMISETHSEINDSEDDFIEIGNYEENVNEGLLQETLGSVSSNEFPTPEKKGKKPRVGDIDFDPFLQIEQQKLDLIREEQKKDSTMTNNPDYLILMSLLPYLKKLDALEKLQLRTNIQNVVFQTFKQKVIEK